MHQPVTPVTLQLTRLPALHKKTSHRSPASPECALPWTTPFCLSQLRRAASSKLRSFSTSDKGCPVTVLSVTDKTLTRRRWMEIRSDVQWRCGESCVGVAKTCLRRAGLRSAKLSARGEQQYMMRLCLLHAYTLTHVTLQLFEGWLVGLSA
jgi:hypothetical protein